MSDDGIVGAIKRDESRKAQALSSMISMLSKDPDELRAIPRFLDSGGDINADEFVAACAFLRDTWTNTYTLPQPGHIRERASRLQGVSRQQARDAAQSERMREMGRNRITPDRIRAELANPRHVDPSSSVEATRIASLKRILSIQSGGQREAPKVRKRGAGGLAPLRENIEPVL